MVVLKDHYYKLASEVPQERVQAAVALLKDLSTANDKEDWDYALNRLMKGLSTTRQGARYGFSMALTEVAQELITKKDHELTVSKFIQLISDNIEIKSNMKGKDERAAVFGKLFAFQTLINSKIIFNSEYTSKDDLAKFTEQLLNLATQKSWLRETVVFTLCRFIEECDLDDKLCIQILQQVNDLGLNISSEGIAIYLTIPSSLRVKNASKIQNVKSNWKNSDPLSKGNTSVLAKALKDVEVVNAEEDNKNKQKGSWSPKIHFVWDILLNKLLEESDRSHETPSKKRKLSKNKAQKVEDDDKIQLKEFWKVVVDESLFADKSSHERKYWGFEIFIKAFKAVPFDQVQSVITPNLLRCMINQSSQPNRMLHKISVKCLNTIKQECTESPMKAPEMLKCVINPKYGGCWNFDLVTKSKTTEGLINCLSKKADYQNEKYINVLIRLKNVLIETFEEALKESKPENEFKNSGDNVQKWCLNMLLQLIRGNKLYLTLEEAHVWVDDIIKLIVKHSFFKIPELPVISKNIRSLCQDRLNSILGDIINYKRNSSSWSMYAVKYIQKLESKYELEQTFDDELSQVKAECLELLNTVEKMKSKASDTLYSFELLFSMVLLQIYMGDEDSFTVVNELKVCFEGVFVTDDNQDSDASIVLTEIIMSFISKKSTLLRKFCYIIWESLLCQKDDEGNIRLNEECLTTLFQVLTARENKEGQQSLFDEEGMMVDEDSDNDGEKGDDHHDHDHNHEHEEEEQDGDNEDDEDDEDDDDDSDSADRTTEIDKETNLKLAQALGIPTSSSGEVKYDDISSGEDDSSSYESESADDDEMLAMDGQLSKIFKERRDILSTTETGNKRKSDVLEAREQMIFFKHRILDLLEIFTKTQPESHLNFIIIKPVIQLINLTLDKGLGTKAHKYLKTRLSKTKLNKDENFSQSEKDGLRTTLTDLLKWTHEQVIDSKSSNNSHALSCNSASILAAKNLMVIDENSMELILEIYTTSLKKWATNPKIKTQPVLFFDFINWVHSRKQTK